MNIEHGWSTLKSIKWSQMNRKSANKESEMEDAVAGAGEECNKVGW